ncbi:hypothetical protein BC937DRAFT_95201 [Endogone sp. FLAS-F59071]|nr:hypothetical protein BC937DRAFT_95201 [Endogone sp. FLAS-F59071]|eukprot:RUS13509.1 hypothetical protein BC937DRAFT_95201 [Endogone sp. FLAS-F59071]
MVHIPNPYRHGIKTYVLAGSRGKGQFDNGLRGGSAFTAQNVRRADVGLQAHHQANWSPG